ncbi:MULTISPECIES: TIGR00282 family metallophosphoesterase [Bacillales]|jgi:metallophosphoesterase (TIGR00282 family)|uniref:Metallophosphoesterase n=1 Tax=Brevibacillus aydinogluensis TaxID=927786 RepID=A0AA48MAA7_9BACL|nr:MULTISPECIES: TIGR00282 family metallophosphoesterase [Bacillales]REK64132.1 MAG: TIGR00282 family metallophosphoesterase [Brevibacillus sp.]MBR8659694.1 TIGR00282 family metallophosphoesterase [Brevibacillus sp. NL20B1]MDT3417962.1 metallophosphoesterase (TIGR00282 family) [Brevibacillus aydinogluensis]NNV01887.1 TIGR00282 family metallophosphoesterase [Brevibacillus sp. MCWH]UFJ60753.1 TIGR00282 family metallophosphoesterase [Anoxybacillus sediminis]
MKLLFIGDIMGAPGRDIVKAYLPLLKRKYQPTFLVANGENAAHGRGITEKIAKELFEGGVQAITLGNHTWDNKDIFEFIDSEPRLIRPANFPAGAPGQGITYIKQPEGELAVINLQGRSFLPPLECPFQTADKLVEQARKRTKYIFVDFHAEATSEKQALAWYLDGRVSAVVGTHTHVQTADERVLPQGTGFLCDVGMCGPMNGILGMEREAVIRKFLTQLPVRFEVAGEPAQLNAVLITLDKATGHAKKLERIRIDDDHPFME